MIYEIKPGEYSVDSLPEFGTKIFLAGTIEQGDSPDWQSIVVEKLNLVQGLGYDVIVMNPRRDEWDASWKQEQSNPQFNEQVNWELGNIEESDIVFFHILPDYKSPITLMELGFCAGNYRINDVIVCCPDGFYRKGNVDIMSTRSGFQQFETLDSAIGALITRITIKQKNP
jgi:hypothetical protein